MIIQPDAGLELAMQYFYIPVFLLLLEVTDLNARPTNGTLCSSF